MRKCPTCQTVYGDDTLAFCLSDGAALQSVRDTDETLTGYDPNATLAYPQAQATNRTLNDPRGRMVVPLDTAPPTPPPQQQFNTAPPQVIKQGVSPVVVGVLAGLLVLSLGTVAAFVLKDSWATPSANNANTQPASTPVAVANANTQPTVQREVVVVNKPASNINANYPRPQATQSQPPPSAANTNTSAQPTNDEFAGNNCYQLKIRRNTIFARHGFIFKTPDMIDYFSRQPWYRGTNSDVSGLLSPAERRTIARIQRYENSLGCR